MTDKKKTASDFHPVVLDAFDKYVHGNIDRREFLKRASVFAVGTVTANTLLNQLAPNYAEGQEISPDDDDIKVEHVKIPSEQKWDGYLATPRGISGKLPAVLVIHENRGRNPYIEDVTRRLAKAGYLALAPDALTSFGGWPGNDDEGRTMQRRLDPEIMYQHWVAALGYLKGHPRSNGNLGALGFCYGGGVVNRLATTEDYLLAAVPYYGRPAKIEDVANIKAALQIHNAGEDTRILTALKGYKQALKVKGIEFTDYVYPGAQHGFHNYSTPRYDEAAATLAWRRTLEFFGEKL